MDHIDFKATSFVQDIDDGGDVPLSARRFLLIPIDGCVDQIREEEPFSLTWIGLEDFGEDNGWEENDWRVVAALGIGKSIIAFDGIAQVQTVVRVR